ncbi:glycosyltransferase family 1 protein [Synechocystis sp. LKSZ1]|uniref:glycosyltransferase family 4 protein n=1 Tax=Synechocystis sp. LKSZ1 TaxID=3144951 RepID=UPI00336C0EE4
MTLLVNLSFLLPQPTGISVYAANIVPYLAPLKPTLLTAQPQPGFDCCPIPANLTPAQGSRGHLNRLYWTQTQLPRLYRQHQGHLLFSPIPEAPLGADCRTVVMVHDLIPLRFPNWKSPLTPYFRWYIPAVLRQAEHIVCNSQATAQDMVDFWQVPARKITPILLGYNQDHFRPPSTPLPPTPCPYFLYLGRPDPHKNVARLIAAFAQLPEGQDCELLLAGPEDPRYTPRLRAQTEALGISAKVKWLNYVPYDQLPQLMHQATALVFPSLWEGFGFPVLEAMACGTAVITSQISSLPEVVGDAGLLVNPYDISALAEAMQALLQNSSLRQALIQKGLVRASQLTWHQTGQQTRELLQHFL